MRAQPDDIHQVAHHRLQAADLLYTKGRRELVELLATLDHPVTMPELLELRPKLTQSSMYRNMTDLEGAGIVQKVLGTDERTRYELAEPLIGHHHHSICEQCGAVGDFEVPAGAEAALEAALAQALGPSGFRVTGHRLDVVGRCQSCDESAAG